MNWQKTLKEILGGYFSDWSIEEGVSQMIFVSESNSEYHHLYLSTLKAAFESALQEDKNIVKIINTNCYVKDIKDAQKFLNNILNEYIKQYNAAVSDTSHS